MIRLGIVLVVTLLFLGTQDVHARSCTKYSTEIYFLCSGDTCGDAFMLTYDRTGYGCGVLKDVVSIDAQKFIESISDTQTTALSSGFYKVKTGISCIENPSLITNKDSACSYRTTTEKLSDSTNGSEFTNFRTKQELESISHNQKYYDDYRKDSIFWSTVALVLVLAPILYVYFRKSKTREEKLSGHIKLNLISLFMLYVIAGIIPGILPGVYVAFYLLLFITLIESVIFIYLRLSK